MVEQGKNTALDRSKYFTIQTPQCFSSQLLKSAYQQPFSDFYTDDASVVEALGAPVHLITGHRMNLKITCPEDLVLAEACLKESPDC